MHLRSQLIRRAAAVLVFAAVLSPRSATIARAPVPLADRHLTYILPLWNSFADAPDEAVTAEIVKLRTRIGEGPRVRVGFTSYLFFPMPSWTVDPEDRNAVRAAIAPAAAQIEAVVVKANRFGIPLCLSIVTPIRELYDGAQAESETEDRRNMQWHSDNSLATGWWTHSQYARKQRRLQEAYVRELGRTLAGLMSRYPQTLVAASGDAEVELSYARSFQFGGAAGPDDSRLADYSPFALAEFRDWLRAAGMYAPGQPLAGQAWTSAARYAGDPTPAELNGDFGTAFTTWSLRYFDWSLADPVAPDPNAIPRSVYGAPGWQPGAETIPGGFDAPRSLAPGNAWWDLWNEFRQQMVWRHNRDFAQWITTSADDAGNTVPAGRWYSDQIPADYLFGHSPANPDFRLYTSASPHWTADVAPYGSLGITSFNAYLGTDAAGRPQHAQTLAGVAPAIAARRVRWGILEWNPSVPAIADPAIYEAEMRLVEQYRPSLLVPFLIGHPDYRIYDTPFEAALKRLVDRIQVIPLTLSRPTLYLGATADGAARTPAQTIRVAGAPGESPPWQIASAASFLTVQPLGDGRSFSVGVAAMPLAAGTHAGVVTVTSSDPGYSAVTLNVIVSVTPAGASGAPIGSFDTPSERVVVSGEVAVTGWAVDDIGISGVDIYRSPLPGEPREANGLVFVGGATLVDGARPDVERIHSTRPMSNRAGWGYMLLTNMLPGGGNGEFTLWAYARDYDGRTTLLGSRRIDARNAAAALPFGTIDTPRQGETVSGTIVNFGWALTPMGATGKSIPADGSTIAVYIDNVFVGRPVYNQFRSDIAELFPGYANTGGAVGYFVLDTTTLSNGVHTIAWSVTDTAGHAQGIGSRYFTVANP